MASNNNNNNETNDVNNNNNETNVANNNEGKTTENAGSATTDAKKIIRLKSYDGEIFGVDEAIAMEFVTVKSYFEDEPSNNTIMPLLNVSSTILSNIITYYKRYLELKAKPDNESEINEYNAEFLKDFSNDDIKQLILAANYLDIEYLLDLLCETVADRMKNKSVEYVRKFFSIENDFTPEEEEQIRQEHAWAFEGVDSD